MRSTACEPRSGGRSTASTALGSTPLADGGLDGSVAVGDGAFNLRRLVCDLLEEYGRHTGHADLLREAVDGRTGEDPDEDWQPPI